MALNVFELFGKIAIDSSGAKKGINNTVNHAKDAEGKLTKTFKKIGTAVAAAFSVKAIVDFGKQCTEAYASIAAEESAFAQIMGDYADTANAKLKAVSDATGVSATRMTGAMTSLTAKFKGLGYNVEDATTLAADGLLIASDAAAFWDMSLDESMSHLNSFINGSYEGGEAIGLFANDTQMAAYAVEQGIVKDAKAWAALDEAQRQATRLDYAKKMMADSGATGQAAKEAYAYANVMANLKEGWRQFLGVVGKPVLEKFVLPAMQKLNDFLPKLTESVSNGIVWLEEGFDKIASYFTEVFTEDGLNMDALPNALTNMFRDLGRSVGGLLTSFGRTLKNGWNNTVWPMIQRTFKAAFGIEVPAWSDIEKTVTDWWDGGNGVAKEIAKVCNWTLNLFGAPANVTAEDVSGVLSTWWTNTKGLVQNACNWVLNMFGPPVDTEGKSAVGVIAEWWAGVKANIEAACTWTLTSPDASALDKLMAKFVLYIVTGKFVKDATNALSDAFAGIGSAIETVCDWIGDFVRWLTDGGEGATTFKAAIVGATAALIAYKLVVGATAVWTAFIEIVKKAKAAFLALNLTMALNPVALVIAAIVGLIVAFVYLWNKSEGFRQFWIDAWNWICQAVSDSVEAIKGHIDTIVGWWNSITSAVNGAIESVKTFLGLNATPTEFKPGVSNPASSLGSATVSTGGGVMGTTMTQFGFDDTDAPLRLPGFATGLDYVPRDNFLARLHQGEAVLTRNEADAWRSGSGTARLESALAQVADLLRDIARNTGTDKSVVLDSGALVGQLAPGMNAYLGHQQRLNGRGNA